MNPCSKCKHNCCVTNKRIILYKRDFEQLKKVDGLILRNDGSITYLVSEDYLSEDGDNWVARFDNKEGIGNLNYPCAFLNDDLSCSIHGELQPWACRAYPWVTEYHDGFLINSPLSISFCKLIREEVDIDELINDFYLANSL